MTRTIDDPRMTESMLVLGLNGETVGEMRVRKTREGKPKSRNGCRTCKLRRVKCDETKPHCMRCTRFGQRCDGYIAKTPSKQSLQISTTRTLAPRSANPTPNPNSIEASSSGLSPGGMGMGGGSGSSLSPSPIDGFMPGAPFAGRSVAEDLERFHGESEKLEIIGRADPWTSLVQTICSRDALLDSTLHRVNSTILNPNPKSPGGMVQDFLCFVFEHFGDRADEQILGGLRVLRDEALKSMPSLKERVEKEYTRLEEGYLNATMGVGNYTPIANDMSHTFETIAEARTSLELVVRRCKYFLRSSSPSTNGKDEKEDVVHDLKRWDLAYGPLLKFARSKGASEEDFLAASLLRLSWLAGWLCVSSPSSETTEIDEREKRQVRIDVDEMTSIAELLCRKMAPEDEEMSDTEEQGVWAWDMQILVPVLVVGWVCGEAGLRKMAGEMLGKSTRRKGVRDGVLIGKVMNWLMTVEANDGEKCRVEGIRLTFNVERSIAAVRCLQIAPEGLLNSGAERKVEIPW